MRSIDLSPSVDHRDNLDGGQVGEGEVVGLGEGQDVALASDRLGLEEARFEIYLQLVHRRMGQRGSVSIVSYHRHLLLHNQPALP